MSSAGEASQLSGAQQQSGGTVSSSPRSPPNKKARTSSSQLDDPPVALEQLEPKTSSATLENGGSDSSMGPVREGVEPTGPWSWPVRLDEIAQGPQSKSVGVTDSNGHELTWSAMATLSKEVAMQLKKMGLTCASNSAYKRFDGDVVSPPSPIAVVLGHSVEAFATTMAVLRQGYPLLPLSGTHANKDQRLKRLREALELFEPVAVIADVKQLSDENIRTMLTPKIPERLILMQDMLTKAADSAARVDFVEEYQQDVVTTLDSVLAYIFTSGSTGQSKCVTATNRMAWAEMQWYPSLFRDMGVKVDPFKDRWRVDHEMGWWGAAFFGEVDVGLAMHTCIVFARPDDLDVDGRGVTMMGALPSQLQRLWPDATNLPKGLRVVFSWAERCDVELGKSLKRAGVKMADLLIASEYWLSLASPNLEVARWEEGPAAHAMRPIKGAHVHVLDQDLRPIEAHGDEIVTGLLGISGPHVSPGYVERLPNGSTAIGAGPLSRETFKEIDGKSVVVPQDLVKRRKDCFLSMGRGGGTIKVRGGVLMATNVVELELQQRSIAAACLTDPVHVGGGVSVVLQIKWLDVSSFKESMQQASFLRLPIVFMCEMPRNESTGKVQKALVQATLDAELKADLFFARVVGSTQRAQLLWYTCLAWLPCMSACFFQPWNLLGFCKSPLRDNWLMGYYCIAFLVESIIFLCVVAWTHSASAHAGNLGESGSLGALFIWANMGFLAGRLFAARVACALVCSVILFGIFVKKHTDAGDARYITSMMGSACCRMGSVGFAAVVAGCLRLVASPAVTAHFIAGLLCIFAVNRRLPPPHWKVAPVPSECFRVQEHRLYVCQRIGSICWSFIETLFYMMGLPFVFLLTLPSLMQDLYPSLAWRVKQRFAKAQPVAQKQKNWPFPGPRQQLSRLTSGTWSDGSVWVDVKATQFVSPGAPIRESVQAQTAAGVQAQKLAHDAGVDFVSVDSLKLSRLSVMLKKQLKRKAGKERLEFADLREACMSEHTFVNFVDDNFEAGEEKLEATTYKVDSLLSGIITWLHGDASIHREGATQAPWDCQVDVLFERNTCKEPLDHRRLDAALKKVMQQHPLLRARPPPDDATDTLMGAGGSGCSTTASATWALVTNCWSKHRSWSWGISKALRWAVAESLWQCWPRTLVTTTSDPCYNIPIHVISKDSDGWTKNPADEVHSALMEAWNEWWNSNSMLNICLVNFSSKGTSRQFLYASLSHKYADGGAAGAFMQSLSDCYDACSISSPDAMVSGTASGAVDEHPVLDVNQKRLRRYLSGRSCPEGSVDCYISDTNNDSFSYDFGHSVGVQFTEGVCNLLQVVGLRLACSEEIAWLSCIVCALCRIMPDEELINIMIVHNGRLGQAEGAVACTSQYVILSIPCAKPRSNTPLADIASRVKFAISHGRFRRPAPCEQAHAKINIGGMVGSVGSDGAFSQVFRTARSKKSGWSRAPHVIQLRMDKEGPTWSVKDFKCHQLFDPKKFWESVVCAGLEIADGWFTNPLIPA